MRIIITLIGLLLYLSIFAQDYNITFYGASEANKNNATAIQKAIDKCNADGGGVVIVPKGTYFSGTLYLKSNVNLHVQKGATLKACKDPEAFPLIQPGEKVISRMDMQAWKSFIYAYDQENISLSGEGTIDGGGYYDFFQDHIFNSPQRPYGIHLNHCTQVKLYDLNLESSAFWMLRLNYCNYINIHNLRIYNHVNINNDGIDIDCCRFVRISDSHIDSSDDALCFKTEGPGSTTDVVVTNCILSSFASAFKLGTGSAGNFERFAVSNLIIRPSVSKIKNHEFDAWGGLGGIDIASVDGGQLSNLTFSNIIMDSIETPIFVRLGMRHDRPYEKNEFAGAGQIRGISFSNIRATNAGKIPCSVTGYKNNPIKDLCFHNIDIQTQGGGNLETANTIVPFRARSYPVNRMFDTDLPAYGMYFRFVEDITLTNVNFNYNATEQRPAFVAEQANHIFFDHCKAEKPNSYLPIYRMKNVQNITIAGHEELTNINDFISVEGEYSKNIQLTNSSFRYLQSAKPVKNLQVSSRLEQSVVNCLSWKRPYADGGMNYYRVYREGQLIGGTRDTTYCDYPASDNKKVTYAVETVNGLEKISEQVEKTIKSKKDTISLRIVNFRLIDGETIELLLNKPVAIASALQLNNYSFSPKIKVNKAIVTDKKIILKTAPIARDVTYQVKVSNLRDNAQAPNTLVAYTHSFTDQPLKLHLDFESLSNFDAKHVDLVKGAVGKAADFNGINSFILIGNRYNLDGNMAIGCWLKLRHTDKDAYYRVLSKRLSWNATDGYELEVNPLQSRINLSGGASGADDQGICKYTFDGQWVHIAVVFRDHKTLFYINGKLWAQDDLASPPASNSADLTIGATPHKTDVFDGLIDELYIFNRSISETEVKELFNKRTN